MNLTQVTHCSFLLAIFINLIIKLFFDSLGVDAEKIAWLQGEIKKFVDTGQSTNVLFI